MQFPFQSSDLQRPNPIASFVRNLKTQATQFLNSTLKPQTQAQQAPWAHISAPARAGTHRFDLAMSIPEMEERLAGIPVYALSNAAEEFVLVSGKRTGKSLGLFCFKKEDAEALLDQMRSMNKDMREGARVVPVALNKVEKNRFFFFFFNFAILLCV